MQFKKYIPYLFAVILSFSSANIFAQYASFLNQGNITYEKKVNVLALLQERWGNDNDGWTQQIIDAYKKGGNQFKTYQYNLAFRDNKTLYTPIESNAPTGGIGDFTSVANDNTVYTNLDSSRSVSQKSIYGDRFLISDSTRKIHWKITDELREIAGFQCRRANAVIMDSIFVVAFYTNQIPVSGGPESFTGLPGMILLLALPHQHAVWTATKVSVIPPVIAGTVVPPVKGKPMDDKAFYNNLQSSLKDWGKSGAIIMQNAML